METVGLDPTAPALNRARQRQEYGGLLKSPVRAGVSGVRAGVSGEAALS
jgi:hypothetical protein